MMVEHAFSTGRHCPKGGETSSWGAKISELLQWLGLPAAAVQSETPVHLRCSGDTGRVGCG